MARFHTILVANRGEIALRVMRSAAAAGLRSVAVYSDADVGAPHVRGADAAVAIGPAAAAQSYLSIPVLLEAAQRSGADAIHPGYGFLSERAQFARAVTDAGLVFIGPPADVMDAMARKDRARAIAVSAGVPVLPAADLTGVDVDTPDGLAEIGRQVGFPLLAKAAGGGGGKGMRIVRTADELRHAVESARREAQSAFGDDTLLFERYVESGRHIEVQVVADEHGRVVHLFERDCSVQRRHQKVIEEAPASLVSEAVRDLVRTSAVALAREVGYVNVGTVEFLVAGEEAYFLEMNTRLQVEHPVTELITGVDLVALQLSIAQGEPLPFGQEGIAVSGHAIEARVYAEDPYAGFLPQAGVASYVRWPASARVDAALESGQHVGTEYDPMLGKIVVAALTREAAATALVHALDQTAILGLRTNVGFLRSIADSTAFRDGQIDTAWLDTVWLAENDAGTGPTVPEAAWYLAAWALATAAGAAKPGPLTATDGWRLAGPAAGILVRLSEPGDAALTRLLRVDPVSSSTDVDGRSVEVRQVGRDGASLWLEVQGRLEFGHVVVERHAVHVAYQGQAVVFRRPDPFGADARRAVPSGSLAAPMPGTVLAVHVGVGDAVEAGETLAVMEAMKMELALKAPFAGTVTSVAVSAGDRVDLGAQLVVVDHAEASGP